MDDDQETAELLVDLLEAEGCRVRVARQGQEGLARVDEAFPDMVMLDVEMPVLDGPAMALEMFVKDMGRERIPILLCSGILNLSTIANHVGTPYFLAKPYTLDALLQMIARVLAERLAPTPNLPSSL